MIIFSPTNVILPDAFAKLFDIRAETTVPLKGRPSWSIGLHLYWMKWNQNMKKKGWLQQKAPTLVTIDWHRDLARPDNEMKNQLKALDTKSLSDAANFVWARFDQTNDGHIFCAAWLNLIGDIILLKNSAGEMQDSFIDIEG